MSDAGKLMFMISTMRMLSWDMSKESTPACSCWKAMNITSHVFKCFDMQKEPMQQWLHTQSENSCVVMGSVSSSIMHHHACELLE